MVDPTRYIPEQGDIIWITLTPQAGHEQAGRRPAVILTPKAYNEKTSLAILCPITNKIKGYPFEVLIPENLPVSGVVLSDQAKSLDWKARDAEFICKLPSNSLIAVLSKLSALLTQKL